MIEYKSKDILSQGVIMKNYKYDLKKLTKEQIAEIVKAIDVDFVGVENFMMETQNPAEVDKDIVEMIDKNAEQGDFNVYARYHKEKHYVSTSVWDEGCYWNTPVHLYEDHFEVVGYDGLMASVTKEDIKNYVAMLDKFLGKKQEDEAEVMAM